MFVRISVKFLQAQHTPLYILQGVFSIKTTKKNILKSQNFSCGFIFAAPLQIMSIDQLRTDGGPRQKAAGRSNTKKKKEKKLKLRKLKKTTKLRTTRRTLSTHTQQHTGGNTQHSTLETRHKAKRIKISSAFCFIFVMMGG